MRLSFLTAFTLVLFLSSCGSGNRSDKPLPPPETQDHWTTPDFTIPQWSKAFSEVKMATLKDIPQALRPQIGVPPWGLSFHRGSAFWTAGDDQGFRALWVCNGKEVFKILDEATGVWKGSLGQISRSVNGAKTYIYAVLGYHMGLNLSSGWTLDLESGLVSRNKEAFGDFSAKDFTSRGWDTSYLLGEEYFSWNGDWMSGIFKEKDQNFLFMTDGVSLEKKFPLPKTSFPLNGQVNDRGNYVFAGVENFDDYSGFQYWTIMEIDPTGKTLLNKINVPQTTVMSLLPIYGLKDLKQFNAAGTDNIQALSSGIPLTIGTATLHAGPDSTSGVLGTLVEGTSLEILETQGQASMVQGLKAPWLKVRTIQGKEGWVFGALVEEKQVFSAADPLTWNDFGLMDGTTGARVILGSNWKSLKNSFSALGRPAKILTKQEEPTVLDPTITSQVFLPPDMEIGDFGSFFAGASISADQVNILILKNNQAIQRRGIQVGQSFQAAMANLGKGPGTTIVELSLLGNGRSYGFRLAQGSFVRYFLLHLDQENKVRGVLMYDGAFQD